MSERTIKHCGCGATNYVCTDPRPEITLTGCMSCGHPDGCHWQN